MKIIGEAKGSVFPMKVRCEHKVDKDGLSYGNKPDFCGRLLEIEESDVKKHPWFKYPDNRGVDYGIVCPVCRMFTTIDADKLPKQLKDNAKEIYLERGMYKGDMKDLQKGGLFEFVVIAEHPVTANDISEAMAEFMKQHPGFDPKDLQYVRYNGERLPYVCSSETMERIYYMPGCPCGETDCIHDPMADIARSCKHQSDMTPDKWVKCDEQVAGTEECSYYDDECK